MNLLTVGTPSEKFSINLDNLDYLFLERSDIGIEYEFVFIENVISYNFKSDKELICKINQHLADEKLEDNFIFIKNEFSEVVMIINKSELTLLRQQGNVIFAATKKSSRTIVFSSEENAKKEFNDI